MWRNEHWKGWCPNCSQSSHIRAKEIHVQICSGILWTLKTGKVVVRYYIWLDIDLSLDYDGNIICVLEDNATPKVKEQVETESNVNSISKLWLCLNYF